MRSRKAGSCFLCVVVAGLAACGAKATSSEGSSSTGTSGAVACMAPEYVDGKPCAKPGEQCVGGGDECASTIRVCSADGKWTSKTSGGYACPKTLPKAGEKCFQGPPQCGATSCMYSCGTKTVTANCDFVNTNTWLLDGVCP